MKNEKLLIFVPTYNEKDNVVPLYQKISETDVVADVLFLDDNSPDGTGKIIDDLRDQNKNVFTIHRSGKLGLGTAHKEAFKFADENGYDYLLTMDADFTHDPKYIPDMWAKRHEYDVVIGSRYVASGDISDWTIGRKCITYTAHFFTKYGLGLPYDCTGAFRLYNRKMIECLMKNKDKIKSIGYSFMFESLFRLKQAGAKIGEVPIKAQERFAGETKISRSEIFNGLTLMLKLVGERWFCIIFRR